MKPRTKLQHTVYNLAERLPKLSDNQKQWAFDNCIEHFAFYTKNNAHCMDCGETFSPSLIKRKTVICPSCNTKLKAKETRKRTIEQIEYLALAQVWEDFQVFRYFKLETSHKVGEKVKYHAYEILLHFLQDDGKREVVARLHASSYWNWSDSWCGALEIRDRKDQKKYDVMHTAIHPDSYIKPKYSMYGIDHNLKGCTLLQATQVFPFNQKVETLVKAKQYSLVQYSQSHNYQIVRYWDSIKICMRNRKIIKDAGMFFDYLELLTYFRRDLRSPKYLFPSDLKKEHDRLVKKKREIERKQEIEHKKKRAILEEQFYKQLKGLFFGIEFKEKDLIVKVMDSVQQFVEEGDLLKHCVYANEYYKRQDSLILSARKKDEILETIEVDLKEMKVVQARGKNNQPSKYNNEFIRIVSNNMDKIHEIHQKTQQAS
jgi:DNA-directed RNA polymerase subunit RPC12/RpoP